jgi:putative transposase
MSGDNYFIKDQNSPYFVTFTIVDWIDVFTRKEHKLVIIESLNYCVYNKGLIVYAWCLMSNHLHMICVAQEGYKLSDIIRDFKKFTAKAIIKQVMSGYESRKDWMLKHFEYAGKYANRIEKYKFWQESNHAVLLSSNEMINQRLNYTHQNPVRAMIVEKQEDYLFSSAVDYAGQKGLVKITYV